MIRHAAVQAIRKCIPVHRTGVHMPHSPRKGRITLGRRTLIHAKNTLILPRKGVPEIVLKERTRTHDDWRLSKILDHSNKLLANIIRKISVQQLIVQFGRS